jgi:hypothetical protein
MFGTFFYSVSNDGQRFLIITSMRPPIRSASGWRSGTDPGATLLYPHLDRGAHAKQNVHRMLVELFRSFHVQHVSGADHHDLRGTRNRALQQVSDLAARMKSCSAVRIRVGARRAVRRFTAAGLNGCR